MNDASRIALARAELEKGLGYIKAAIHLISSIDRPSIEQVHRDLINEMQDIESCAFRLGN